MKIYSFENLLVWQKSIKLNVMIYKFTKTFPKEEMFGLTTYEKNIEKIVPIEIKKYKSEKQNMLFLGVNMLIYSLKNENKIYNYFDFQLIIARAFFYNSIWPNIKLEEYLQIKK